MTLIELPTPERSIDYLPLITHARVVHIDYEADREVDKKIGHVNVWLAKGFLIDDVFREAPWVPGININVSVKEMSSVDFLRIEEEVHSFLVASEKVAGKVAKEIVKL